MKQERAANLSNVNYLKLQMRQQKEHEDLYKRSNFRPAQYHEHPRQAQMDAYASIPAREYGR